MRSKVAVGVLAVAVLVVGAVVVWPLATGDDDSSGGDGGPTFVIAPVERRDLVDEITVRGEIRRDELQHITSGVDGKVSSVVVDDAAAA